MTSYGRFPVRSAEEAAGLISHGATLGIGGFTDPGCPKAVPTAEEAARQAVEEHVDIVGASTLAAGHLTLVPALRQALTKLGHENMPIVLGGVIPPQDYDELCTDGVLAIFGPGTAMPTAGLKILEILEHQEQLRATGAMEAGKTL